MNPSETSPASRIRVWAARQLADYDARQPGMLFAEGLVLHVDQAYQLQSAVAQLRRERGERTIGYKVGCTSPKIRAQLGIDHCVSGVLYESEQHSSGVELPLGDYANLAIEGELAVRLSRAPLADDFSAAGVPACVSHVFPVIELHHHIMRGSQPSAGELIANNAIHAGFVVGEGKVADLKPAQCSLAILSNDRLLHECTCGALIETIRSSLKWLTELLRARDEPMGPGQIVLTGSIPPLIPIQEECRIRVDAPPFGSVEAKFIA